MTGPQIPRDRQVCFWCAYLDHSEPACKRRAPRPRVGTGGDDTSDDSNMAEWPWVKPHQDWCGEFVEGNIEELTKRKPKRSDTNYDLGGQ